jgi:thiamine-monophosphate kinase
MIDEISLISEISSLFEGGKGSNVSLGIGDDCAAIVIDSNSEMVITTDTITEGVHFNHKWTRMVDVGYKSVVVSVSDVAAMGGSAKHILLSINGPPTLTKSNIRQYLKGFKQACDKYEVTLIGGNYSNSPADLSFTMTVLGEITKCSRIERKGASPEDIIYITGAPGESALGLSILNSRKNKLTAAERRLINRHKRPTPRLEWGKLLANNNLVSAMIDVSDGIALDLKRLTDASHVSALIHLNHFPLSRDTVKSFDCMGNRLWRLILTGGEDYELLFTANKKNSMKIEKLIKSGLIEAAAIGKIIPKGPDPKFFLTSGKELKMHQYGWLHNNK